MSIVAIQESLRPEIPNIYNNLDYKNFRETLIKIDEILIKGGLEDQIIKSAIEKQLIEKNESLSRFVNSSEYPRLWKHLRFALRCNIVRSLTGEALRPFSVRLSDSALFQWFVGIHHFTEKKSISKSALGEFSKLFDESVIAEQLKIWQSAFLTDTEQAESLGLNKAICFDDVFLDMTCVKENIHFPVDWLLLRDAVKSLLSAIKTIRAQGLKHRMIEPSLLMREMNKLCIAMTHTRRQKDSKRARKSILRKMKKLSGCIQKHGVRYRDLLVEKREKTKWTEKQAAQVISRIDHVLNQLPAAIRQAHERIIGERKLSAQEKILSLYDRDVHVLVRGKADNEVEFGQGFLLAEQRDGIIVDWELFKDQPKSDSRLFQPIMKRIQRNYGNILSATTDRGFDSEENRHFVEEQKIFNGLCARSPKGYQSQVKDPIFLELQTRRSQTESRIGIFKNVFLGRPLKSKGFLHRQMSVTWCVLTHNLWVIARKALSIEREQLKNAA